MRVLLTLLLGVLGAQLCAATFSKEPIPVVPIEDGMEVFLEEGAEDAVGWGCKKGFVCPIVDGVCCPGGETCCPDRCIRKNRTSVECARSDQDLAQKKLYEVFQRKRMLDKQEDALAKEQEQRERKKIEKLTDKEAHKTFKANLAVQKQRNVKAIEDKKAEVMTKLKKLAKTTGQSVSKIVPKDVATKLGIKTKPNSTKTPKKTEKPSKKGKGKKGKGKKKAEKKKPAATKKPESKEQEEHEDAKADKRHDDATRLEPKGGWSNYGSYYDVLRVQRWRHLCFLSGLVRGGANSKVDDELVAQVPKECRPQGGRLIFQVMRDNKPARMDVLKDGRVMLQGKTVQKSRRNNNFLSVVASWDVHNGTELFTKNNWLNYGRQYREAFMTKIGDMCMATGVIRSGKWGAMGEVMPECKPEREIILNANNHDHPVRVDVHPNGTFGSIGGTYKHKWVSLGNMVYPRRPGKPLVLLNSWRNHKIPASTGAQKGKYRKASFHRIGNIVMLSGLVRPGKGGHLATLPPDYRPIDRLVFGTNHHTSLTRVDVTHEGHVVYVSGMVYDWVVLDGISFFAIRDDHEDQDQEEAAYDEEERKREGRPVDEDKGRKLTGLGPDPMEKNKIEHDVNKYSAKDEEIKALKKKLEKLGEALPKGTHLHSQKPTQQGV